MMRRVAEILRIRAAQAATDPAQLTKTALADFERLTKDVLESVLADYRATPEALGAGLTELLRRTADPAHDQRAQAVMTAVHNEGSTGIGDGLLIALAYEYTDEKTSDLGTAYREVKAALETACDMQARAELPDNTDAALSAIRAKVARSNNAGDVDAAGAMIDAAIEQKSAEMVAVFEQQSAGMVALLEMGVQQDRLRNAPEDAARRLVQQVDLNTPADRFTALRALQDVWYERGRDAGVAFDLIVSIAIARTTLSYADTADEKGAALNDLGVALSTLGARETGTARLDEADTAYRDALLERTRDRVPFEWAVTQHCLSGLELAFYDKSKDPERLDQAKQHAQAAREVYSKAKAAHYVEWIDGHLAGIQSRRA